MIHILFPAIHFFITLALATVLIGYLQRTEKDKLSTQHIFQLILVPWFLVQGAGYFARNGQIPLESYPYIMGVYIVIPILLLHFFLRKSLYQAAIYSLVVLASAFASGAAVSSFFSLIDG